MKNIIGSLLIVLGILTATFLHAQIAQPPPGTISQTPPQPTPYQVISRDANQNVWERTTYEKAPDGTIIPTKHHYTELATGLNYKKGNQWVESKEEIDILPQGGAAATHGQHQVYFSGDIYNGEIELVTPDGEHLKSQPVGLSYDDGTNSVMIAVLTNSIGYVLGANQVVYPNAFTGFKADLRYTYTKAGFEQDVILRQQPPTPESLGLNPDTARLQVLTEFFSPPAPAIKLRKLAEQSGLALDDQSLEFGQMQMGQGRAFLMGQNAKDMGALVGKQWVQFDGRQFLVEEVPVDAIVDGLAALPLTAMNSGTSKTAHLASGHLTLPRQRLAKNDTSKTMLLAKAEPPSRGLVLDYQTVNTSLTNFTFQGDTTYFVSGTVNLYGTNNVLEGGAVIKFTNSTSA